MIEYETPKFIKDLQNSIKKEELYTEEDNDDYGLEKASHVTLVPCLDNDINLDELKKFLKNISEYDIILTDISKFECENFDVLKCAVKSKTLKNTNKEIVTIDKIVFVSVDDEGRPIPHGVTEPKTE